VYVSNPSTVEAGTSFNCFTSNGRDGASNYNLLVEAPFINNWWGSSTGPYNPTTNPSGLGDSVSNHVDYDPYLNSVPSACAAEEQPPAIVSVSPEAGSTSCLKPKVGVTLLLDALMRLPSGEFNPAVVTLKLDDVDHTSEAQVAQTGAKPATHASILYTPPSNLSVGSHTATFVFPSGGGPVTYNWYFTVPNTACPASAPLEAPLGDASSGSALTAPSTEAIEPASADTGEAVIPPARSTDGVVAPDGAGESAIVPLAPVVAPLTSGPWRYLPHPGLFAALLGSTP
jgi:hypothetical protein